MDELCLVWMRHVSYEWVMSTSQTRGDPQRTKDTYQTVNVLRLVWIRHVSYEWVMSMSQIREEPQRTNATHESVMSHMNESCLIWISHDSYEWLMSPMNASCQRQCQRHRYTRSHNAPIQLPLREHFLLRPPFPPTTHRHNSAATPRRSIPAQHNPTVVRGSRLCFWKGKCVIIV